MNSSNLESRAAKVSLVTGASVGVTIFFQLVSVPICLHFWGSQLYGEWLAVFAAANLLRVVDNGYVAYAGNRLNILYHDNQPMLHQVLASGAYATALLGILQGLALLLMVRLDGLGWLLGTTSTARIDHAQTALIVLVAVWIVAGTFFSLVQRLMIPTGMLYQSTWWSMAYQASLCVAVIVAAVARLGLIETSILVASIHALVHLLMAMYVWRKLPEFVPQWRCATLRLAFSDLCGSMVFSVNSASQQTYTNGLVLVVSSALGASFVPAFTTTRTLVNLWNSVISALTNPLVPDVVRLHVQRQGDKLLLLARAHEWLVGALVTVGVVVTYPATLWAYGIWTHHSLQVNEGLLAALLASMLFIGAGSFMTSYLSNVNDKMAIMATASCRTAVSLVLGVVLVKMIGLAGIGVGVVIAEVVCYALMVMHFFKRAIQLRVDRSVSFSTPLWLASGIVVACTYLAVAAHSDQTLLAYYSLSSVIVAACSWVGWRQLDVSTRTRLLALGMRMNPLGPRR